MEFNFYVKVNVKTDRTSITWEDILQNVRYNIPKIKVKSLGGKRSTLQKLNEQNSFDIIKEFALKDRALEIFVSNGYEIEVLEACVVSSTKTRWIYGEYYAHEYTDSPYTTGRGRRIKYSNGYKEYLIECTDPNYSVADGIWDEVGCSRISNGSGDHFTPYERGLF